MEARGSPRETMGEKELRGERERERIGTDACGWKGRMVDCWAVVMGMDNGDGKDLCMWWKDTGDRRWEMGGGLRRKG